MTVIIDGGAGVTFPDTVQQTNAVTNTGGNPRYYAARAWVNFNGTGTIAIRAAAGVSSLADLGTGTYRINFSISMPDVNYAITACCDNGGALGGALSVDTPSTGNVTINTTKIGSGSAATSDVTYAMVSVFR